MTSTPHLSITVKYNYITTIIYTYIAMPGQTQQESQDAWEALASKIQKAADEYPKPEGLNYAYGTAGFRMK
jgi:hypothetical protein